LNFDLVADEIINRLFNHKPFIEGEIRFMIKQFEEIRNDQEINQLFQSLERITDFKESQIDFALKSSNHLNELNHSVDSVDNLMQDILTLESNQSDRRNNFLKHKNDQRVQKFSHFVQLMKTKANEIDLDFEQKENNLRQYYKDLEIKLKISQN
jgi:hypothetical protein